MIYQYRLKGYARNYDKVMFYLTSRNISFSIFKMCQPLLFKNTFYMPSNYHFCITEIRKLTQHTNGLCHFTEPVKHKALTFIQITDVFDPKMVLNIVHLESHQREGDG